VSKWTPVQAAAVFLRWHFGRFDENEVMNFHRSTVNAKQQFKLFYLSSKFVQYAPDPLCQSTHLDESYCACQLSWSGSVWGASGAMLQGSSKGSCSHTRCRWLRETRMVPPGTPMTLKPGVPARTSPLPYWEEVFDVLKQTGILMHVRNTVHPKLQWRLRDAPHLLPPHLPPKGLPPRKLIDAVLPVSRFIASPDDAPIPTASEEDE
jgi:hypothetical protein